MSNVYQPSTGLLALDAPTLAAVIAKARGQSIEPAAERSLADSGMAVAGRLDAPLHATIAPLIADGPRLRLLSRARGRLTVTDAALAPATPGTGPAGVNARAGPAGVKSPADPSRVNGPAGMNGAAGATVVVRPHGSAVLHVRRASPGAVARLLASTVGLGPHVLVEPRFLRPLELRDWGVVRSGFDTPTPSGWVGRRERAELHEVRWAPGPGTSAGTALVVARLDDGLAEIRPRGIGDAAFTVTAADTTSVWRRLCALTTGGGSAGGRRPNAGNTLVGRQPGPAAPATSSSPQTTGPRIDR